MAQRAVRRAAIEMKLVLSELPAFDSRGIERWSKALDAARERLKGEASMADADATSVKESLGAFDKAYANLRYHLAMASMDMVLRNFMRASDINNVDDGRMAALREITAVLEVCD